MGDGKVRGAHAEREGQVFTWIDPPDGGHPGEDYNCRCWAEPVPGKDFKNPCLTQTTGYRQAQQHFNKSDSKRTAIINKIRELYIEYKNIQRGVRNAWGLTGITNILPGIQGQITGNVVQESTKIAQEELSRQNKRILRNIEYLRGELELANYRLKEAENNMLEKLRDLENCRQKHAK